MSNALELKNITKTFPGVKALDNMQLSLEKGEIHAICGENGAGKSTLMKIITGVYQPDKGDIILNGEKVTFKNPNEAYDKGISIIYQENSLFPDLTVLENMFIGHEPTKSIGPIKAIDYKAMTYDADILILDEPTAALTNRETEALFRIIDRLKSEGVSMLYISHRLEEIFEIADRVTVIRDGEYVATSDTKSVTEEQLIAWMVGRNVDNLYPKFHVDIGENVLELRNVNQEGVLKNINLNLKRGEILGISGLAGSGRTELAEAISGLTQIESGEIILNGEKVEIKDYSSALEYGMVYVSEDRKEKGLVIPMDIKENITMPILQKLSNSKVIDFQEERTISNHYMEQLSIKAPSIDSIVGNLSGGNQQKVAIAKALACKPKILILDEPTRGVDVGAKSEIHRLISQLAKEGLSIIMVSSDLPEILGMADRVCVMKNGTIVKTFSREEATQEKVLAVSL
ncbi:sugar ABC transporter ATP-binding protein [Schnuerera ultunensis]|nr:sugar ABC transporter ATP-binding protein [Schnuerera ultunensis]